jgi:hypothetical protein
MFSSKRIIYNPEPKLDDVERAKLHLPNNGLSVDLSKYPQQVPPPKYERWQDNPDWSEYPRSAPRDDLAPLSEADLIQAIRRQQEVNAAALSDLSSVRPLPRTSIDPVFPSGIDAFFTRSAYNNFIITFSIGWVGGTWIAHYVPLEFF